jgi:hypothetical protein
MIDFFDGVMVVFGGRKLLDIPMPMLRFRHAGLLAVRKKNPAVAAGSHESALRFFV